MGGIEREVEVCWKWSDDITLAECENEVLAD